MEGMDPISGLWRVRARDGRTALRITGAALLLAGATLFTTTLGPEQRCKTCVPDETARVLSFNFMGVGAALLVAGLLSGGPEADSASAGFPRTVAEGVSAP